MPTIHLTTFIAAPAEVVFDLCRHVGVHKESMSAFGEDAISGKRIGLIEKDDTVTWKARHFFKTRILRVKASEMKKPELYVDEQSEGDFKMMKHEHHFKQCNNGTILIDLFHYEISYGFIGDWFNHFYLTKYIRRLLEHRNNTIKEYAETGRWKKILT
jgi:ligand-binding SRPBCC domain-containing protein